MILVFFTLLISLSHATYAEDQLCIMSMLEEMTRRFHSTPIDNPDVIVEKTPLKVGMELYPQPYVFFDVDDIGRKVLNGGIKPFKIQSITEKEVVLMNQEYGKATIEKSYLYGNSYSRADFAHRSQFFENEDIILYNPKVKAFDGLPFYKKNGEISFENMNKILVKFKKVLNDRDAVVSINYLGKEKVDFVVSRLWLQKIKSQNSQILKVFDEIKLQFFQGEQVRFRNTKGVIQEGKIIRKGKNLFVIEVKGENTMVKRGSVFKYTDLEERPHTSQYNALETPEIDSFPQGKALVILDKIAVITSTKQFQSLSHIDRFKYLMMFLKNKMYGDISAGYSDKLGLLDIKDNVCSGVGVCRHLSYMFARILSETGYDVNVVAYMPKGSKVGHQWLEVNVPSRGIGTLVYVVDAATGYIKTLDQAKLDKAKNPSSMAGKYYTEQKKNTYQSSSK